MRTRIIVTAAVALTAGIAIGGSSTPQRELLNLRELNHFCFDLEARIEKLEGKKPDQPAEPLPSEEKEPLPAPAYDSDRWVGKTWDEYRRFLREQKKNPLSNPPVSISRTMQFDRPESYRLIVVVNWPDEISEADVLAIGVDRQTRKIVALRRVAVGQPQHLYPPKDVPLDRIECALLCFSFETHKPRH